jgi:hypothetical protein
MWLNNVFVSNVAERGNGLYVGLATAHLTHTTMARNGTEGTGLYVSDNGVAALTNAVLAEHAVGIETLTNSVVTLDGALWYGNGTDVAALAPVAITNNYVGDPAFSSDGYHLNAGSAAIDRGAGSNLIFDLDGDPRPLGGAPDLGADEFAGHTPLTLALSLVPGWNLISLPLHPEDPSIEAVLRSLEGRYKHVQVFENCADGNPWQQFDPHATANTLSTLDETKGIWINMAVTGTLVLTGTVPTFSYVPLCAGINLMGYPLDQAQPTAAALNTIAGHYTLVFAYDATTQSWRKFDVNAPDFVNTLAALEPGRGYWVVASEGTTWYAKR